VALKLAWTKRSDLELLAKALLDDDHHLSLVAQSP
jgi:hypothetical protein